MSLCYFAGLHQPAPLTPFSYSVAEVQILLHFFGSKDHAISTEVFTYLESTLHIQRPLKKEQILVCCSLTLTFVSISNEM